MILIPTKHDIRSTGAMGLKIKRCGVYPKEVRVRFVAARNQVCGFSRIGSDFHTSATRDIISPEPSNTLFEYFIM